MGEERRDFLDTKDSNSSLRWLQQPINNQLTVLLKYRNLGRKWRVEGSTWRIWLESSSRQMVER